MDKKLEQKLLKRFPGLYQDYSAPMTQTCMCWGFSHGDGWFDIIWQLSLAIEDELDYSWLDKQKFKWSKKLSRKWNNLIYKLSPVSRPEYERVGKGTKDDPIRQVMVKPAPVRWDEKIVRFLFGQKEKVGSFEVDRLALKRLRWNPKTGFAVDQVKEKFGTLRFYCPRNERIRKYVRFAETLSARTCEVCGDYGKLGALGGWWSTRCTKCAQPGWEPSKQ